MALLLIYLQRPTKPASAALILPEHTRPPATTSPALLAPFDAAILAGQLAPSSIAMYRRDFAAYLAFAETPAAVLDARTLARWRSHLAQETTLSPNSINRMLSAVKRLMRATAARPRAAHRTGGCVYPPKPRPTAIPATSASAPGSASFAGAALSRRSGAIDRAQLTPCSYRVSLSPCLLVYPPTPLQRPHSHAIL